MPDERSREYNPTRPSDDVGMGIHQPGAHSRRENTRGSTNSLEAVALQSVIENAAWGVVMVNAEGTICAFNRAAEHIFGYHAEEIIDRPLATIVPQRLRAAHESGFRRYLDTRIPSILGHAIHLPGLRRDGEETMLELIVTMVQTTTGECFIGMINDLGSSSTNGIQSEEGPSALLDY